MNARPTIPIAPWEAGDRSAHSPIKRDGDGICAPKKPPAELLIGRVFMGRLNVSDLDYMAKAILQLADENHELRERVRKLEERLNGG